MSKLKTYEVFVTTIACWSGEIEARSWSAAKRIGQKRLRDGDFRQIEEEIIKVRASEVCT